MTRHRRFNPADEFDPLVAARCIMHDPSCYREGVLDGHRLDDLQQEAVLAELQVMAQLAEEALIPGDPDREAIIAAYEAATKTYPKIPAGR